MKWLVLTLAVALFFTGPASGADGSGVMTCARYAAECKSSKESENTCKMSMLDTIIGFVYAYQIYAVRDDGTDPRKLRGCSVKDRSKDPKFVVNNIIDYFYVSSAENKDQSPEFCIIDAYLDMTQCGN